MKNPFEFLSVQADRLTRVLLAVMMAAMVLDVLLGVANRFLIKWSISWTEQLARFLLIWISMLGSALAVRQGAHIGIQFILSRLGRLRVPFIIINSLLIVGFLLIVGGFGLRLCISQSRQLSPAMQISMFWPYLAIPAGSLLMIVHYLAALSKPEILISGEEPEPKEA